MPFEDSLSVVSDCKWQSKTPPWVLGKWSISIHLSNVEPLIIYSDDLAQGATGNKFDPIARIIAP